MKIKAIQQLNRQAGRNYRPKPFAGSILFFSAVAAKAQHLLPHRPRRRMAELCGGRVQIITLPGTHLTLLDQHNAPIAAEKLRGFLLP